MKSPTPEQIRERRTKAGLLQREAAALLNRQPRIWRYWEGGGSPMPADSWELFLLKTEVLVKGK